MTKVGFKPILAIGMACIALGLIWFTQIDVDGTFLKDILGPSLLAALGLGFAFVPVTIAAVSGIEDREQGLASGLINTSQQVGGALGLAILAAIANSVIGSTESPSTLVEGFQAAFAVGAGFAILGLIATLVLVRTSDSKAHVALSGRGRPRRGGVAPDPPKPAAAGRRPPPAGPERSAGGPDRRSPAHDDACWRWRRPIVVVSDCDPGGLGSRPQPRPLVQGVSSTGSCRNDSSSDHRRGSAAGPTDRLSCPTRLGDGHDADRQHGCVQSTEQCTSHLA